MWPICDETARIGKVFELAEPRFGRDMERDFRIRAIFPYRDRNRILNLCLIGRTDRCRLGFGFWYLIL